MERSGVMRGLSWRKRITRWSIPPSASHNDARPQLEAGVADLAGTQTLGTPQLAEVHHGRGMPPVSGGSPPLSGG